MCNWVSCWWEKVCNLNCLKWDFTNLRTWRLGQWWGTSLDLSLCKFFSATLFHEIKWYINTNITYANLINANLLQKRVCRSSSDFKLNWHPSIVNCSWIHILEHDSDEEFTFVKQFFLQLCTRANLNFCKLLKLFFTVPSSLVSTWLKKAFIYCHHGNSRIPYVKLFVLGHH